MEAATSFRTEVGCSSVLHNAGTAIRFRQVNRGTPLRFCTRSTAPAGPQLPARQRVLTAKRLICKAAAAPPAVAAPSDAGRLSAEDRAALAKELGYRSIGADLPDDVTLTQVISSLPREVFEINPLRAWGAVATTVVSVALSVYLISISPWYMLPFAWAFAGTAWTGMFVVGHDCGHRSFSKNKLVEDIVGTLMFMPLIYPFEPWRIKHNHHHAHTNKLVEDTAWHPAGKAELEKWGTVQKTLFKVFLGSPLKLWASVGHWWLWHFNLDLYTDKQKPRVLVSLAAVAAFALIGIPAIGYFTGLAGVAKYWLMPWLGYHFWMSTFTVVHHTAPHIPFKPANEWNAAKAQLSGTVHCDYPRWVEFLCHDINVHVPHHVNSKIPWYNLRAATDSLRQNWGQYMTEASWNWRMMKYIFTELHVYDEQQNYVPFDYEKEEPFYWIQRKVLPSTM
ncbi:g1745 [Coccomyxa elongata]